MKYVANLLVAINNVASAEAMVLGLKAGLDARTVFDMRAVMKFSQRLIVLVSGKKIADGLPDAVIRDPEVERAYLGQ